MKKILFKLLFGLMVIALLPVQVAQACSAFIVGKDLTTDGSMLYGAQDTGPAAVSRTEAAKPAALASAAASS